jgi:signal transduction histidine kinase/CheY-like chemotaxis protein
MASPAHLSPHEITTAAAEFDAVRWLKQLPLFADTPSETLELFARAMPVRAYEPGEVLFQQGDDSSDVYLVTRGDTVIRIEQEGRVVGTDRVAAGSCVGEMAALTGQPRSATVIAGSQGAEALIVPGPRFRDLLLLQPSLGVNLLAMMSERLRQSELRKQNAELARRADELGRSKEAADAIGRAKADLLASMSHELRTPLNGIIGLTELVLGGNLSHSQREYLELVRDSGEALLRLINDILDMSKIEAGRLEFDVQPFELRDRVVETLKTVAVRAHRKGLELACHVSTDVPDRLLGDLLRLRQIIVNLVGNAIKFTERGEIVVEITCSQRTRSAVTLQFTVRDTGMGIPKEKLPLLFRPYAQADASIARDYGGTGLGLSISARLVEGMGGGIWADSTVGVGSAFHFTLSLEVDPTEYPTQRAAESLLVGQRALLIQPHATTASILEEMLGNWGLAATVVASGAEGMQGASAAFSQGCPFSFALIDARAAEALACARNLRFDQKLAVLMLLAADQVDEGARCDELQIPHLLKPIKPSELLTFLETSGSQTAAQLPSVPLPPAAVGAGVSHRTGLRILLAEDGFVNQKLALSLLGKQGHDVTLAVTGREVLAALERQSFDLVLMDVVMPEMDGLEATRAIRARQKQPQLRLPIIAMTAGNSPADIQRCLTAGMDAFVAKPVRQELLFATIDDVLSRDRAAVSEVVDWPNALLQFDGHREALAERVTLLLQELPRIQSELANAAARRDFSSLRIAAHTIKIALSALGASRITQLAQQLESISQSPDPPPIDDALSLFQHESQRLMRALRLFSGGDAEP